VPVDDREIERILVITAHPDDVDFGAAGTIAGWTDAGIGVSYCIVTDGDAGGFDPGVPRSEIPTIRRAEQTAAAKVLGVDDVTFLGHPDGRLEATLDLRRDLAREIRRVRPQRVVGQHPERNLARMYSSHPDHRAAGAATLDAVYPDARNPFAFPELAEEGYDAHEVAEVWLLGSTTPDHFVDVTERIDRKVQALLSHESQMRDPARLEPMIREWGAATAAAGELREGRLAEAFQVVDTR